MPGISAPLPFRGIPCGRRAVSCRPWGPELTDEFADGRLVVFYVPGDQAVKRMVATPKYNVTPKNFELFGLVSRVLKHIVFLGHGTSISNDLHAYLVKYAGELPII